MNSSIRVKLIGHHKTNIIESGCIVFSEAAKAAPEVARFSYVYAIALNSTGQGDLAFQELASAYSRHPGNAEILFALVTMNRDAGNVAATKEYAIKLKALMPEEPVVDQLLQSL